MRKFFLNPETMNINEYVENFQSLHAKVKRYINSNHVRLNNTLGANYQNIIENENLELESKDIDEVFDCLANYSQGLIKWNDPGTMININPPASIPSAVAANYFSMYNPNGAQDMSCGYLLTTELAVIKMICQLVGWSEKESGGTFTFGGKSTNLHAIKHGLQRIDSNYSKNGIDNNIVTFSTTQGHVCHKEVCGWLGIGEKNCIRIDTMADGVIDINKFEEKFNEVLASGKDVANITLNGCTTIQMTIDPIKKIAEIRDAMVEKYKLHYKPHIHVDSVIGWVWLFYKYYDFSQNKYRYDRKTLKNLYELAQGISEIKYADSFGVDFHKTGFCPYLSSLYMVRDRNELYEQGGRKPIPYNELEYGNYSPFEYTLELSRPLNGPISAYVNFKLFGIEGFQKIMGDIMEASQYLKEKMNQMDRFEVINNNDSKGFVVLFVVKEKGRKISFENLGNNEEKVIEDFGMYIHKFYLYLFEQQKRGECWFAIDYSSGYHILSNGKKIGVLKAYPMSPFFDKKVVDKFLNDITNFLTEFDKVETDFEVNEVPHKPRPFVYR